MQSLFIMVFGALLGSLILSTSALAEGEGEREGDQTVSDPVTEKTAASWIEFTTSIRESGLRVLRASAEPHGIDRAEGLRFLAQQLAAAVEQELVREPGEIPLFRVGANTINKWGIDSADAKTQFAAVTGSSVYRLTGTLGSARLVVVQVMTLFPEFHAYASLSQEALLAEGENVHFAGREVDVMISRQRPKGWTGAWLEMDPATSQVLIREYFGDWENEEPGRFRIERVDETPGRAALTLDGADALLDQMAARFDRRPERWKSLISALRTHSVNRVSIKATADQGVSDNIYGGGWFRVAADEALVLELRAPTALLWSIQLSNGWSEALDSVNATGAYNSEQAVASRDGVYRFVIAAEDPGVPNWLDPSGHPEGVIQVRFQRSATSPEVKTQLLPAEDLLKFLPASTPRVTPDARALDRSIRRAHAARRWAP